MNPATSSRAAAALLRPRLTTSFSASFRSQLFQRRSLAFKKQPAKPTSSAQQSSKEHIVLEEPDKFRPPSHGSRLPGTKRSLPIRNYGAELSAGERAAQAKRKYPNMMPPEGSLMHWVLMSKGLHLFVAFAVLGTLGISALVMNLKSNSPYGDMLPHWSELPLHPLDSTYKFFQVMKLDSERQSRLTAEKRRRDLEEVQKRKAFRLAHGLEGMEGIDEADPVFAAALASRLERESRDKEAREAAEAQARGGVATGAAATAAVAGGSQGEAGGAKKWLGIW